LQIPRAGGWVRAVLLLAATTLTWVFIIIPLLVVWGIAVVDIVRSRTLSRIAKLAWIAIVLILPVIGTVVYFVVRRPTDDEIRFHAEAINPTNRPPRPPLD
jgi:hypothetical protein